MSVSQLIQNRLVRRAASAFLLVCALTFAAGCGKTSAGDPKAGGGPQAMPVQVKIAQAQSVPGNDGVSLGAEVAALREYQSAGGRLYHQDFCEFRRYRVTAGTPLLQIDPLKQQAAVSSQEGAKAAQEANVRYAPDSIGPVRAAVCGGGWCLSRMWTTRKLPTMRRWRSLRH